MPLSSSSNIETREVISAFATSLPNTFTQEYRLDDRQLTPDSEALVSSDDETDFPDQTRHAQKQHESTPRAYRLNDPASTNFQTRKASLTSNSMSPTNSHPSTQSTVSGIWAHQNSGSGNIGRGKPASSTFHWGGAIWNNDPRKDTPSRLSEVLPSPNNRTSPLSSTGGIYSELNANKKDQSANYTIPFAIPLYPTPKTYRSQSYSVGQLDLGSPPSTLFHVGPASGGRGRTSLHSIFHHRPSRPSMLSEISNESMLGKVKEVDDFEDTIRFNLRENALHSTKVQSPEILREDPIVYQQKYETSHSRPGSSADLGFSQSLHGPLPKDFDSAIEEIDDINDGRSVGLLQATPARRQSNFSMANCLISSYGPSEGRKLDTVKKAIWQSSLDFGGLGDTSQSRRHSFADIPTSLNSIGNVIKSNKTTDFVFPDKVSSEKYTSKYSDQKGYPLNDLTGSYFGGVSTLPRKSSAYNSPAYQNSGRSCAAKTLYGAARSISPHNGPYGSNYFRQTQSLNIVLFKCSRSDVFYVQEGTGLAVKPGDMVIVEADRGTDLGTVVRVNIDWATAKELKEYYSEEHYKWLITFLQGNLRTRDSNNVVKIASSNSLPGSSVGSLGTLNQHVLQDSNLCEMKPKIIKRLAQKHEIQALREKEGSEAKAKRVCMQKVKEHGLQMEILDAEFQMDWKKLTFYYFADTYINFNSLVTDLFKVYKTRIWMSAINPASFATSPLSHQVPSNFGPSAVLRNCNTPAERYPQASEQPKSACVPQATRGYQYPYPQQTTNHTDCNFNSFITPYTLGFSPFTNANLRNMTTTSNIFGSPGSFVGFSPQCDFRRHASQSSPHNIVIPLQKDSNFRRGSLSDPNETWINNYQGLFMNTH